MAHVADLDHQRADLAAQRDALRADMRERAVALYRAGGDPTGWEALQADSAVEAAPAKQLGDIAAQTTTRAARKLEDARTQLAKVQATLRQEQADLQDQKNALDDLVAQQERQQAVMDEKVAAANAALADARAIGAVRASHYAVMGPSTLTAAQIVAWYNAQNYSPRIETSVADLVDIFLEEAADENVRGDLAFAQTIIETGGFERGARQQLLGHRVVRQLLHGQQIPEPA